MKMNSIILLSLAQIIHVCLGQDFLTKFHQTDYKVRDMRAEIDSYDPDAFSFVNITPYVNGTNAAFNVTWIFKIDVQDNLQLLVQGYKFYTDRFLTFPIRFQVGVTTGYQSNIIGIKTSIDRCGYINNTYLIKDTFYYVCNIVLDQSRLPPLIPSGLFKFAVSYLLFEKTIVTVNVYGEVYRTANTPKPQGKPRRH